MSNFRSDIYETMVAAAPAFPGGPAEQAKSLSNYYQMLLKAAVHDFSLEVNQMSEMSFNAINLMKCMDTIQHIAKAFVSSNANIVNALAGSLSGSYPNSDRFWK